MPCSKPVDIITISVGADIIRPVFLKAPLVKGGGFGFAKTGGILLKLPAEFNGMGLQSLRPCCGHLPSRGGNSLALYLLRVGGGPSKMVEEELSLTGCDGFVKLM